MFDKKLWSLMYIGLVFLLKNLFVATLSIFTAVSEAIIYTQSLPVVIAN